MRAEQVGVRDLGGQVQLPPLPAQVQVPPPPTQAQAHTLAPRPNSPRLRGGGRRGSEMTRGTRERGSK